MFMKRLSWEIRLGFLLVLLSIVLYLIHYAIFHDAYHIYFYLLADIAFLPVEVLLVTLVLHRLLSNMERKARLEKLNMVIGTFFSEVGTKLLAYFSDFDPKLDEIRNALVVTNDWPEQEFATVSRRLRNYDYGVEIQRVDLEQLRAFLVSRRDFLLRLLENPTLLEHESFTSLLRAVFHLTEELKSREDLGSLPGSDYQHLANDIKRVYSTLVSEWLDYMKHLKDNYPYLFSLAMRTNPFDQSASVIVG
jgi:hypothetical protein